MDKKPQLVTHEEQQIRQRLKDEFPYYASKCLKIRTKNGSIEAFELNRAQRYAHERLEEQKKLTGKVRALVLKGRQQGLSTLIGGRYYHQVTHGFGIQAFILTHLKDATDNLYAMALRYYEHTPSVVKPLVGKSNAKELNFSILDSGYKLGTAGNKKVGRSSTINLLHGSEVAFWENAADHATGILQAVPNAPGTEIILESTANGVGNYFHQEWQKAEAGLSDFIAVFIPWFWQDEYQIPIDSTFRPTPEEIGLSDLYKLSYPQLKWRRNKIMQLSVNGMDGEKAFKQEYPCNPTEAFQLTGEDSYIDSTLVMQARKAQGVEAYGPLVIGVDPARFGDDRTSISRRQGRVVSPLEWYTKKDTMEVTGLVHNIIITEHPAKVLIDVGGLGAGIVDRLIELDHGDIIVAVNSGASPLDSKKYKNKRAEMWGELKNWLNETPCSIPDDDALHADLCGIKYKFDSNSRLQMESKEDMKKRGVRSPDLADSLCLTFALPPGAISVQNTQKKVMTTMANAFNQRMSAINKGNI